MGYIERAASEIDPKQLKALAKNLRSFADRIERVAEKIEKQEKEKSIHHKILWGNILHNPQNLFNSNSFQKLL